MPAAAAADSAGTAATAGTAGNALALGGTPKSGFASAAQGIKGALVYSNGTIENSFNAINGGAYVVANNGSGLDRISFPFPVAGRVMVVGGGAASDVGGVGNECIYTLRNFDVDTVDVVVVDDANNPCNEEFSLLIF